MPPCPPRRCRGNHGAIAPTGIFGTIAYLDDRAIAQFDFTVGAMPPCPPRRCRGNHGAIAPTGIFGTIAYLDDRAIAPFDFTVGAVPPCPPRRCRGNHVAIAPTGIFGAIAPSSIPVHLPSSAVKKARSPLRQKARSSPCYAGFTVSNP